MSNLYVLEGPITVANVFAIHGVTIPEGKFVVVVDDDYANGGRGPCLVTPKLFDSREEAMLEANAKGPTPELNQRHLNMATGLANWAVDCAMTGYRDADLEDDLQAFYAETGVNWIVVFLDGDHEYELALSEVPFMGNKSARQDQIQCVYAEKQ